MATQLTEQAAAQLCLLKRAADETPYAEVVKALEIFRDTYAQSVFAERAAQLLSELLNAKAEALEGRAREAEAQKDYARAIQLYELYLTYFSDAVRYSEVEQQVGDIAYYGNAAEKISKGPVLSLLLKVSS